MRFINKLTFRSKLIFFTLLNILLVWSIAFFTINITGKKLLERQYLEEAKLISITTSMNLNEFLLTQDYISLSLLISNLLKNEQIIYAVITDINKNIIFSSFQNKFPQDLLKLIKTIPEKTTEIRLLKTESGRLYHISQPILEGKIGNLHLGFSIKNIEMALKKLNYYVSIAGIIMFLAGAVFSVVYSLYLSNPFRKLINATEEIRRGNLNIKLKVDGNDEIAKLIFAFNMMIEGIKDNIQLLEESYRKTGREEKVQMVRNLVRDIAEEINNPLTGIKHLIEISRNSESSDEKLKMYLHNMEDGLNRINVVIQELIKFTGEISHSVQKLYIDDIINQAIKIASGENSEIKYELNLSNSRIPFACNGSHLTYAFVNLIRDICDSNFRRIRISTSESTENFNIELSGIEPVLPSKEWISSPLRVNISCRIIEMHGGNVTIKNESGVKKFVIMLPFKAEIQ